MDSQVTKTTKKKIYQICIDSRKLGPGMNVPPVSGNGAILGHKAGIEKFDDYSEAWTKASLNVISIKQILDLVHEDV